MPLTQVNRIVGQSLAPPDPPGADPSNECWQAHLKSQPVDLMFLRGVLVRIDVSASGISTDRGVEVGQPVEAIRAAYGPKIARHARGSLPDDSATWTTVGRNRGIRFEVVSGKVVAFYIGTAMAVGFDDGCA